MSNLYFDICSDLHIDQWDTSYNVKNPCGIVKNYPFKIEYSDSKYLIIAGDISDNLELSIEYLNKLSENYEKVLFVDGNHEHSYVFPNLYTVDYINDLFIKNGNDKIVYLPKNHYKINDTVFVGFCGWWDFCNENQEEMDKTLDYFDDWMPHFTKEESKTFIKTVISHSKQEYNKLKQILETYALDNSVKKIIVVTHTVPHINLCNGEDASTEHNSKFMEIFNSKKISHWIHGHVHEQYEKKIENVHIICNPRGRPEDYDREVYKLKTFKLL